MELSKYTKLPLLLTLLSFALISSYSRASQDRRETLLSRSFSANYPIALPMAVDSHDLATQNRSIEKIRMKNAFLGISSTVLCGTCTIVSAIFAANESNEECQDVLKYGSPIAFGALTVGSFTFFLHNLCKQ